MERVELTRIIREALSPESDNSVNARARVAKLPPDVADSLFVHTVSRPIAAELAKAEPFAGGGGFFVQRENGYSGFHANEASLALAERVIGGETPEQAVAWLERVLSAKVGKGTGVLGVYGIQIDSSIDLGHGVTILPFSELPDSRTKRWISKERDRAGFDGFVSPWLRSAPEAALTVAHTVRPLLWPVKQGDPPTQRDPLKVQMLLDDARLALTAVGPSCPVSGGYWFQFDDPDLSAASFYGGVSSSYQEVLPWPFSPPVKIDASEATRLTSAFLNLGAPLKSTLRLALRRFNHALRRPPHGDRALDLAIALESMLVDGGTENTYKIGLRAALLLGGTIEQRRETRAVISALYALRSALVHDGVLPSEVKVVGVGKRPSPSVVNDATQICARIFQSILSAGAIPEWYEYELADTGRPS
jgi:Apea-like HEPN